MKRSTNPAIDALHIFVLAGFAVAQPVFGRLAGNPGFLQDQHITVGSTLALSALLCLLVPGLLVSIELLAGIVGRRARSVTHSILVGLLLGLLALPAARDLRFVPGVVTIALALALGGAGTFAYGRWRAARLLVTAASPALLVFPGVFLARSPVAWAVAPPPRGGIRATLRDPVPVVLVVFDEFSGMSLLDDERQIDPIRYPGFAALARDATWFRDAASVHPRTENAVPAILTGNYPRAGQRYSVHDHPVNLFTILLAAGTHEVTAFEPFTRLFPAEGDPEVIYPSGGVSQLGMLARDVSLVYLHDVLPIDFRIRIRRIPRTWFGIREASEVSPEKRRGLFRYGWDCDRREQFDHFLDCIGNTPKPPLYFAHVAIPHFPWCYLPSGRRYRADAGMDWSPYGTHGANEETWGEDELSATQGWQRYLLQVGYADHCVARLIERLRAADLYDRSLVVVVADHGVAFRAGASRRNPSQETLAEIWSIPLFVKLPHQREGGVSDRGVASTDVLPTILEVLGVEPPVPTDGHSLLDPAPRREPRYFFWERGRLALHDTTGPSRAVHDRMLARFGSGANADGLFRVGPHSALVGRRVEDLAVAGSSGLQIELARGGSYYDEDPATLVPCEFAGRVLGAAADELPVDLAIAVNGTVRAVTRTYRMKNLADVWSAMLPESAFRPGENDVQIFTVSALDGVPTLRPSTIRRRLRDLSALARPTDP